MSVVFIEPRKHVVKETQVGRMFRRALNFDDVFTYFNVETGEWILAYWVNKTGHLADEVEDLGGAMEKVTPDLVQQIIRCWGHVDWAAKKRRMQSKQRSWDRKKSDAISADQERWDWLKRRYPKMPIPYMYASPVSGGQLQQ